jgi:hypothetical protein
LSVREIKVNIRYLARGQEGRRDVQLYVRNLHFDSPVSSEVLLPFSRSQNLMFDTCITVEDFPAGRLAEEIDKK